MEKSRLTKTRFLDSFGTDVEVEETKIWKPYLGPQEKLNRIPLSRFPLVLLLRKAFDKITVAKTYLLGNQKGRTV